MVENKRIEEACLKEAFVRRSFTDKEQELIRMTPEKASGNFAVKEAVSKAFGTGFRQMRLQDIEVLRDEYGKPYVNLFNNALAKAQELSITNLQVSISNVKEYTIAYVIAESIGV